MVARERFELPTRRFSKPVRDFAAIYSMACVRKSGMCDKMCDGARGKSCYTFGPLLHRWGNAFPEGPALPADLAICPDSQVAFCGDYVDTPARMGSYECALLSGANVVNMK